MDYLAELNRLRQEDGKVPLKVWSGDEQQLRRAIYLRRKVQSPQKTEEELIAEYLERGGDISVVRDHSAKGVRRQGGRRRNRYPKTPERTGRKPKLNGAPSTRAKDIPADCFTLIELAKDIERRAQDVRSRARLRPALAELNVPELGRWVFRLSDRQRVLDILGFR